MVERGGRGGLTMAKWIVEAETLADIVNGRWTGGKKIVQCKNCVFAQGHFTNTPVKCGCGNGTHHEEYFCADGERRE